jgi:hypothetical protein
MENEKLQKLSEVDTSLKRPPKLRVVWGPEGTAGGLPKFDAVIQNLGVKYTMFDVNGKPLRATVRLRLMEAQKLAVGQPTQRANPGRCA